MRTSDGRPRGCVPRGLVIQYHAWHHIMPVGCGPDWGAWLGLTHTSFPDSEGRYVFTLRYKGEITLGLWGRVGCYGWPRRGGEAVDSRRVIADGYVGAPPRY
jgi:hypothetical protein